MSMIILFFVLLTMCHVHCCAIRTFRNTVMLISMTANGADPKEITINGCLELQKNVAYVKCKNQDVHTFYSGAMYNLPVTIVIFNEDNIRYINPGSFSDLSKLKILDLQRNKIQNVKAGTFNVLPNLEELLLKNNEINEIEDFSFGNMTKLKELILGSNGIKTWNKQWFANNLALDTINLEDNQIKFLPEGAFDAIPNVNSVFLKGNRLGEIHSGAFRSVYYLNILDVSENGLRKLHRDTFSVFADDARARSSPSQFFGIRRLCLHKNNLTYLPDKVMDNLTSRDMLSTINIHSNPWQCACYKNILRWAYYRRLLVDVFHAGCVYKKNPVCVVPKTNSDLCQETNDGDNDEVNEVFFSRFKSVSRDNFFDADVDC